MQKLKVLGTDQNLKTPLKPADSFAALGISIEKGASLLPFSAQDITAGSETEL
ncbi:hypothetical protein [Malonomonas rubra]|uniref:hypothetical protein n=1 Tax=Malonomonas rubra TaxID=57040 RepID=UPI001294806F|nr:hypothetical protein [Malonomonas rubra]